MRGFISVFKRELRSYFSTPLAYVFLVVFLLASSFMVFQKNFFEMRQASMWVFFDGMPLLFIFLVPALAMRLWAEERKQGTMEVLLTLPARDHELVVGKFLASWVLLATGLALTLVLPFTVAGLGNLDWGPVIGGYAGALLLGAGYLAVGQFVSSTTENQILAFILALVICVALYGLGAETFASLFPDRTAALLRAIGTGARFESIARGVIDLRDVVYYLSLTGFFLAACIGSLHARRWA